MVQINKILGNIDLWLHIVWQPHPDAVYVYQDGEVTPFGELCHFILRSSPATENGPQSCARKSGYCA